MTNDLTAVTPEIRIKITRPMVSAYLEGLHHEAVCVTGADGKRHCPDHSGAGGEIVPEELWR